MQFSSTQQTISWFHQEYMKGNLELKPPFQRKPVWVSRQKCALIESILLGLPVPEIYIQVSTSPDGKTTYAVVDGQQRVRTVLQFIGCDTDPAEEDENKFSLDKLPPESKWQDYTFEELLDKKKSEFWSYEFAVRLLKTSNEDDVRDMFKRLNRYLSPLKPQELRNATYMGPFVSLVTRLADNEYWAANRIVTPASIRRMGDVEFVSELVIGVLHGPQGGSRKIIDEYYATYEDYEEEFPEQRRATRLFHETLTLIQDLLPEISESRWGNKTDFYTLFVSLALLLRTNVPVKTKLSSLQEALDKFTDKVDRRLANENSRAPQNVVTYVRAVEKGANDKKRRADRHSVLLEVIEPYFTKKVGK